MTTQQQIQKAIGKQGLSNFTAADYKALTKEACKSDSILSDEQNPVFIFESVSNDLLCLIAQGKINLQELAALSLSARGYNTEGKWVGFGK